MLVPSSKYFLFAKESQEMSEGVGFLRFRRALVGEYGEQCEIQWAILQKVVAFVRLTDEPDKLAWKLTASAVFSVKSFYLAVNYCQTVHYKFLWKVKIPLRVKTFILACAEK